MRLLDLLLESISAEVGKSNEQMHQHRYLYFLGWLFDDFEDSVND